MYTPRLFDQRMILADIRLAFNYIYSSTPNPLFSQRLCQSVRIHERASSSINENRCFLHLAQKSFVHDVISRRTARGKYKYGIALLCEFVQVNTTQSLQTKFSTKGFITVKIGFMLWISRVYTICDAKWDKTGKSSLGNPPEANEAGCAFWSDRRSS